MKDSAHPASLPVETLLAACEIKRGRRSGPGGQHRNKVETAIVIKHSPSLVTGEASERRSQNENRRVAIQRLRVNLALKIRTLREEPPSQLWVSRCRAKRLTVADSHSDFPALLAEALDVIAASDCFADAAATLAVSSSQLVKLLKLEPRGLEIVNAARRAKNERPLR